MQRSRLRFSLGHVLVLVFGLIVSGGLALKLPLASRLNLGIAAVAPVREAPPSDATQAGIEAAFEQLPLTFVENHGQLDERVNYYVQGRDTTLYFTPQGVTFALTTAVDWWPAPDIRADRAVVLSRAPVPALEQEKTRKRWVLKLDFVGANPDVHPAGQNQAPGVISYFTGPPTQWKTGRPTYSRLIYADLWPGIDLIYTGMASRLKYTFLVRPGADPRQIKLAYRGTTSVKLNDTGQLVISTPLGGFTDDKPYAYQEIGGQEVEVASAYHLQADTTTHEYTYSFNVGAYDTGEPLVLDPTVLVYAGFIGGGGSEIGYGVAVDGAGNAYVSGSTTSQAGFPVTVGPDLSYNSGQDAFVAKIKSDGSALVYAGYIGGAGSEVGRGIAIDREGSAYLVGFTDSDETSFPAVVGPDLSHNGGLYDAFIAKVRPDGTGLAYAGYIGGNQFDYGTGVAVDSTGNAYIAGDTASTQATFPVKVGPNLVFNGTTGDTDAFVAKVSTEGSGFVYAGYIGSLGYDQADNIAVDGDGRAYIVGTTNSSYTNFPVKVGPDLTLNGGNDAFIARVKSDGAELDYAGFIGGFGPDQAFGVAVDDGGNAYVAGFTMADEATFPVKIGPDLTYNGDTDAFVAKVKADGTGLDYAGYVGGAGPDWANNITVDRTGHAYVTGKTLSNETTFPVNGGPDLTFNGGADVFVAKLRADGAGLDYAGYVGGSGDESGVGVALDGRENVYIIGRTSSTEATFPVRGRLDGTYNGGDFDAFVVKIGEFAIFMPLIRRE